jgi:hypothetical protein
VAQGLIAIWNYSSNEERTGVPMSVENVVFIGGPKDRQVLPVDVCINNVVFPALPKDPEIAFNRAAGKEIAQLDQIVYERVQLAGGLSLFVLKTISVWHVFQRLLSFYSQPLNPTADWGSWPVECQQRAFVEGAKWWDWQSAGATMWNEDQRKAEAEAVHRYGEPVAACDRSGIGYVVHPAGNGEAPSEGCNI